MITGRAWTGLVAGGEEHTALLIFFPRAPRTVAARMEDEPVMEASKAASSAAGRSSLQLIRAADGLPRLSLVARPVYSALIG